ncbi:hypothetical protein K439DRAFT_1613753 [Ramaria rubella]|nr:hypothetical protein K439DRAFT_1613753 [Ramaria rubella]
MRQWFPDFSNCWPKGLTAKIRGKLMRRILREGNVLPIVTVTCIALMLEIYSTTTSESTLRIRLRYRSSPIADFGIIAGSAKVISDDQLAYILPDKSVRMGQDPDKHFWIYFRTQKGEEVHLECNMFTFNMCVQVDTAPYLPEPAAAIFPQYVPSWFKDRLIIKQLGPDQQLLTERRRASVLRDEGFRTAMETIVSNNGDHSFPPKALDAVVTFMSGIAERPVSTSERYFFVNSLSSSLSIVDETIWTGRWKRFPAQPQLSIERDPGE